MCGIAGKLYFDQDKRVTDQEIQTMARCIEHRGPDHTGVKTFGNVGMANTRLAIIDLSPQGWQPMADKDERIWIVFNGEIYNYQELRDQLVKQGVKLKSTSDTEVVIYLYKQYKEKCLDLLRGMFALAIWDSEEEQLFVARDRLGKKPFKYYMDGSRFIFASELKAILANQEVKPEPDFAAIHMYLGLQYCPSPMTGFANIKKLPAGHYGILKNRQFTVHQYWKPVQTKEEKLSEQEWIEKIRQTLEESVKLRMIASDVPVAAMLSGGIDSSAVVAYMSKLSDKPVDTFSVGFKNSPINELPFARMVAERYHTRHHELELAFTHFTDTIQEIAEQFEEPFADTSAVPTWYISQAIHPHAKVVMGGDGGDESFYGYNKYNMMQRVLAVHKLGGKALAGSASLLPSSGFAGKIKRKMRMASDSQEQAFLDMISFFRESELTEEYQGSLLAFITKTFKESNQRSALKKANYFDFSSYVPDDLMVKTDIATMRFALEMRAPMLDHVFVELVTSMPDGMKLRAGQNKYLFKKAMRGIVPDEILERPKQGFGAPLQDWFNEPDVASFVQSALLSKQALARPWVNPVATERMARAMQQESYTRLWALLTLELWFAKYF